MFNSDPVKQTQILALKQEIEEGRFSITEEEYKPEQLNFSLYGKDQGKLMGRDFALATHYKLHDMSIQHLKELKKDPANLAFNLGLLQQTLADVLFVETGVESYELDAATEFLGLEQDKEYMDMCADYTRQVGEIGLG